MGDKLIGRNSGFSALNNFYMENNMLVKDKDAPPDDPQNNKNSSTNKSKEIDINKINDKEKYDAIINKNKKVLELFCIVILGILRVKQFSKFDIIINDCYYKEYINSFGRNYSSQKLPATINNFHILNFLINKMDKIHDLKYMILIWNLIVLII